MFKIWYFRFILNYPTHFYNHVTPKLGLTLQNQYCFSKWDTICNVTAKHEDFCYGAEKGPYGHPTHPAFSSILFNTSFREGKFSELSKRSNIIPLPKKGDNSDPSNFRPVTLLSGIGKLQERIVFKNIYNFLNENNLIYN